MQNYTLIINADIKSIEEFCICIEILFSFFNLNQFNHTIIN